jgi:membrane protease YdiL (CAAX protease family)
MVRDNHWQPEALLRLAARFLLVFAAGGVAASALRAWLGDAFMEKHLLNAIVGTIFFQGGLLLLVALFLREQKLGWVEAFGFRHELGWALALGVGVAVIALPGCWGLQHLSLYSLERAGFDVSAQEAVRLVQLADAPWKQAYLGIFAIALAPLAEELVFRGILYPFLKRYTRPGFAVGAAALIFAIIHGNLVIIVPLTFLAVALTLLYEWTGNLLACIVVHGLFNAANFVMLFVLKNSGQLLGN